MKIELRKLKIAEHLSEETTAFSAEIHVDGVLAAHASNHGTGGCNQYHFTSPILGDLLEQEAKRQFPDDFEALDQLVEKLMEDEEDRKSVIKFRKKGFDHVVKIFTNKRMAPGSGRAYYCGAVLVAYTDPSQLAGILKKNKSDKHVVLTETKPL